MDYFTSDWHLGHRNVIGFSSRPFNTLEEMREKILDNSVRKMRKGDNLYFLGDLSFNAEETEIALNEINKRKINFFWVLGNHDVKRVKKEYETKFVRFLHNPVLKRNKTIIHLSHFPMLSWNSSFRNSIQLYGHIHDFSPEKSEIERILDGKALNVNVEMNDYKPYSLQDIFDVMENRGDNWDYKIFNTIKEAGT